MSTKWRVYGKDTVACKLSKADIPGFFSKQVVISPNEAALVVKNGKIEETITGSSNKVSGLWDRCKSMFGGGSDVDIFIVDTSPFDVNIYLGESSTMTRSGEKISHASGEGIKQPGLQHSEKINVDGQKLLMTKAETYRAAEEYTQSRLDTSNVVLLGVTIDNEVVSAECRLRLSPFLDDIQVFSGLLKGRTALATWDIAALVRDEVIAKVLIPKVAQYRSDELRGNSDLYATITSDVKSQLLGTLNLWGLNLEDFIINWGLTDAEIHEINKKRQKRADEVKEFDHKRQLSDAQRKLELTKTQMSNLQQLKVAEQQGDQELKDMLLVSDIGRDLMIEGARVDVAKIDAQVRTVDMDVKRQESNLRLEIQRSEEMQRLDVQRREYAMKQEKRMAEIDADDKEMKNMMEMQIRMATEKHERQMEARRMDIDADFRKQAQANEERYQQRMLRADENRDRMGMQERITIHGMTGEMNEAKADVLKEVAKQQTEQTYADASDAKTEARMKAEAAKNNTETFKNAEDRERKHQNDQTKLATDMMQASKQTPGQTVVTGTGTNSTQPPPSSVNIVNVPGQTGSAAAGGLHCPHCNGDIQATWKACPNCGNSLGEPKCKQCGAEVKPDWKACPECGDKL